MSSWLYKYTKAWSTSELPTKTTLTHVNPAAYTGLVSTLKSLSAAIPTETNRLSLYNMARAGKAAQASLTVISAQNYLATATNTQEFPAVTTAIWNSTMELQQLEEGINLYQMELSPIANGLFAGLFGFLLLVHVGLCIWKKQRYFGICLAMGTACELAGYAGRVASIGDYSNESAYLCQIICLTLAPAILMAGVYFELALLTVVHGRKYSMLRPLWFSYIFICCDLLSLVIQAAGGGSAAIQLQQFGNTKPGTYTMIAGIAFQVLSMTIFLVFLFDFLRRTYFHASAEVKFSLRNLFDLFFVTKRGRRLREEHLNPNYNQNYEFVWSRKAFAYFPLVLFLAVFFIYVRCIYRLVELKEGWSGYLITHEEYVMTLDGLMVLLMVLLFVPFHPGFLMGSSSNICVRAKEDEIDELQDGKSVGYSTWSDESTKLSDKSEKTRSKDLSVTTQVPEPVLNTEENRHTFLRPFKVGKKSKGSPGNFAAVPYSNTKQDTLTVPPRNPNRGSLKSQRLVKTESTPSTYVNPYEQASPNPYERASPNPYERSHLNPYETTSVSPQHTSTPQKQSTHENAFGHETDEANNAASDLHSLDSHDEDYFVF